MIDGVDTVTDTAAANGVPKTVLQELLDWRVERFNTLIAQGN